MPIPVLVAYPLPLWYIPREQFRRSRLPRKRCAGIFAYLRSQGRDGKLAGFPIAAPGGPPSAGALGKNDAGALLARLRQSAPPRNPQTPDSRLDAGTERLQSANQVRVSLEKLMTTINEDEPVLKQLAIGMHAVINKILAGVDPQEILTVATAQLGKAIAPASPVPPQVPTAGMPGMPQPPGMAGPPGMVGGAPGGPVSPGVPPG